MTDHVLAERVSHLMRINASGYASPVVHIADQLAKCLAGAWPSRHGHLALEAEAAKEAMRSRPVTVKRFEVS